ncbi:hypothetical protein [Kitasatospora sp. NPDC088134]|uniref:hypothetical protein n=1 Tax=Kitasatospora sp. NPDC088134 TaxID=3364071 RepID=UPI00382CA32A
MSTEWAEHPLSASVEAFELSRLLHPAAPGIHPGPHARPAFPRPAGPTPLADPGGAADPLTAQRLLFAAHEALNPTLVRCRCGPGDPDHRSARSARHRRSAAAALPRLWEQSFGTSAPRAARSLPLLPDGGTGADAELWLRHSLGRGLDRAELAPAAAVAAVDPAAAGRAMAAQLALSGGPGPAGRGTAGGLMMRELRLTAGELFDPGQYWNFYLPTALALRNYLEGARRSPGAQFLLTGAAAWLGLRVASVRSARLAALCPPPPRRGAARAPYGPPEGVRGARIDALVAVARDHGASVARELAQGAEQIRQLAELADCELAAQLAWRPRPCAVLPDLREGFGPPVPLGTADPFRTVVVEHRLRLAVLSGRIVLHHLGTGGGTTVPARHCLPIPAGRLWGVVALEPAVVAIGIRP